MKKPLIFLLLSCLLGMGWCPTVLGQATDKLLFGGMDVDYGVSRYNPITLGAGVSARFQQPITPRIAATAKVGLTVYRINYLSVSPYWYLGYGYNPISGFGFNSLYTNFAMNEYRTTGISVPVSVGPRIYLTNRIHADLGVGADVAVNKNLMTDLRVEPGVGYMLPLKPGRFLDVNAGYYTSFARGSGFLTLGVAYGLRIR